MIYLIYLAYIIAYISRQFNINRNEIYLNRNSIEIVKYIYKHINIILIILFNY